MSPSDQQLLLLAQARALLSERDATRIQAEASASGAAVSDLLRALNLLSAPQLDELRKQIEAAERAPATAVDAPPTSVATVAGDAPSLRPPDLPGGPLDGASAVQRLGKYEVRDLLGQGGMGIVYRAYDPELRREVALKMLLLGTETNPEAVQRFLREARTAAALDHPGIVPIHEVGTIDGRPYYAMAYVKGVTLQAAVGSIADPSPRERARLVRDVAEAVAHAHERGVIHRDLKPANVLVDASGAVHVLDFGLARRIDEHTRVTAPGQMLGTPDYMAPEQIDGDAGRVGPPADVYALGVILYQALTGRPPFTAASVPEMLAKALLHDPEPPRRFDERIPTDLETVCLKALAKEPGGRYPTARELADDLGRYLRGEAIAGRRESRWQRCRRWARRHAGWVLALGGLAALALVAVGWGLVAQQGAGRATTAAQAKVRTVLERIGESVGRLEDRVMRLEMSPEVRRALAEQPLEMLDGLIAEDPDFGPAWSYRGKVKELLAPNDPAAAEADFDRGCAASPERALVWYLRGMHFLDLYAVARGSPGSLVQGARVEFERLPPESPRQARWRERGLADLERMRPDSARAGDVAEADVVMAMAQAALHKGTPEDLQRVLDLLADPTHPRALRMRGIALYRLARFDEAVVELARSVESWPRDRHAWYHRGLAELAVAHQRSVRGQDPRSAYEGAIAAVTEALRIEPGLAFVHNCRGIIHCVLGLAQGARGQDPRAAFGRAVEDFSEALRLEPGLAGARINRAGAYADLGGAEGAAGLDPTDSYRRAIADCEEALRFGTDLAVHAVRGAVYCKLGTSQAARGADPRPTYAQAQADFAEALRRDPNDAVAWINRGVTHTQTGKAEVARGLDPRESFRQAAADFTEALRHAPEEADIYNNRGNAAYELARAEHAHGSDPHPAMAQAEADYRSAAERGVPGARLNLGLVLLVARRWDEAIAAFEAGARELPFRAAWAQARIQEARAEMAAAAGGGAGEPWDGDFTRARAAIQAGDYAAARQLYLAGLARFEEAAAGRPTEERAQRVAAARTALLDAHYNLACIEALRSAGKEGPRAAAKPLSADEAQSLRDAAFAHLDAALDLGWRDARHLQADPDLEPLHADGRWNERVARAGTAPK